MDRRNGTFKHFPHDPKQPFQLSQPFKRNFPITDQLNNNFVTFIGQDQKARIWIGAWTSGLNVYDPATRKMGHFENNPEVLTGLSTNNIWGFFQSSDGTLFFYTGAMQMVFKLDEGIDNFPFYDLQPFLNKRTILFTSIMEDFAGNIWLGTKGLGLLRFDPKNKRIKVFKYDSGNTNSLTSNDITNIRQDRDGLIWIGTTNGLNCLDPESGQFKRYQYDPMVPGSLKYLAGIPSLEPTFQDSGGNIWVMTFGQGLNRLDRDTDLFQNFKWDSANPDGIGASYLSGICEDPNGNIWIGASQYLDRLDRQTMIFEHFEIPDDMGRVRDVISDETGNIWFIGEFNELARLNPATGQITKYNRSNSQIPTDEIFSIMKTPDGRLWMNSRNALIALDPDTETFQLYPCPSDVLYQPELANRVDRTDFVHRSWFSNSKGTLFFPGKGGYYKFRPDEFARTGNQTPPRILISDLILDDKRIVPGSSSILEEPIWNTEAIILSHRQNSFSFGITCIDYHKPEAIQLRYQLQNYESIWRSDVQEGLVVYNDLPPGQYLFRVQGANSNGFWSNQEANLLVKINPPWWSTWWAILLYGFLLLSILYYVRFLELRRQRRKLREQQRINAVTAKFVPNAFLSSLGKDNIMEVKLGDAVEQEVTVMFSDIRDYTTLAETMTPKQNFRFVNAFNQRMGPIIQDNNGFVNQYLGDAIMALFKGSAKDSLSAAIQMQKEIIEYNQQRIIEGLIPIRMGSGLHTGQLIMGIIGDDKRMDAATISDAVNTASRIESLTKHFNVNILLSEESLQQIKNQTFDTTPPDFHFRFLGKVQLKGKKEPTGIYECFDGDPSDIAQKKMDSNSIFEKGLQMYHALEFASARIAFEQVLEIHSDDLTARFFLERSVSYMSSGVPDDWTGVEVMSFK